MKCRSRQTFEYYPVDYILWGNPSKNPTFKGIPAWIHQAFTDGQLRIDDKEDGSKILCVKQGTGYFKVGTDNYLINTKGGLCVMPIYAFDSAYEIIE